MEKPSKKARDNGQRSIKLVKFIQCELCNSVLDSYCIGELIDFILKNKKY